MDASYSERPRMLRDNPIGFLLSVALIFVFGLGLLILLIWYIRCISDRLEVRGGKVTYSHGIFSKDRTDLNVASIRSVRVYQSLQQRIFKTGDVFIFTAGDKPEITVKGLPNPQLVKRLLES